MPQASSKFNWSRRECRLLLELPRSPLPRFSPGVRGTEQRPRSSRKLPCPTSTSAATPPTSWTPLSMPAGRSPWAPAADIPVRRVSASAARRPMSRAVDAVISAAPGSRSIPRSSSHAGAIGAMPRPDFRPSGTGSRPTSGAMRSTTRKLPAATQTAWKKPSWRFARSAAAICCRTRSAANQHARFVCMTGIRSTSTASRLPTLRIAWNDWHVDQKSSLRYKLIYINKLISIGARLGSRDCAISATLRSKDMGKNRPGALRAE